VALEALKILIEDRLPERSAELGDYLLQQLRRLQSPLIREIRGKGLFIGIEIEPKFVTARTVCEALMGGGLLSKETHEVVVRLAPPLIITPEQINWAVECIARTFQDLEEKHPR
jgi:ornithine--oxo-acid transaminase